MNLSTEELIEINRFHNAVVSSRRIAWWFLALGLAGIGVSISLLLLLWDLGGVLDEAHQSLQGRGEDSPGIYQSAIALSLQSTAAMISGVLGGHGLAFALLRFRGTPGLRVLEILTRRLAEQSGAQIPEPNKAS